MVLITQKSGLLKIGEFGQPNKKWSNKKQKIKKGLNKNVEIYFSIK